jgi:hypothetical protein
MLASFPASMLNQKPSDLGILNRFKLGPSRSSGATASHRRRIEAASCVAASFILPARSPDNCRAQRWPPITVARMVIVGWLVGWMAANIGH